jgi:hypothetical protein
MSKCYNYNLIKYKNYLFNNIDATYILHLENNGRYENIIKQLNEYKPTKIVYIVFNKGFKKCKKEPYIINSIKDIIDTNNNIFNHAKENNYNNILILEDDFIFSQEIKNKKHTDNIDSFLNTYKNMDFIYSFGTLPFMLLPFDNNNYISFINLGAHCIIYPKNIRNKILNYDKTKILDWDLFRSINFIGYNILYYKPLCYQLFPKTDNSLNWGNFGPINKTFYFLGQQLFNLLQLFRLNKNVEPGYSIFYLFSKIILLVILYLFNKILVYKKILI